MQLQQQGLPELSSILRVRVRRDGLWHGVRMADSMVSKQFIGHTSPNIHHLVSHGFAKVDGQLAGINLTFYI